MKTTQCHSPHSWIFRARYCKCALFSNKQRTTARTHGGGPTPTSLAQSRLFFSKQEAVDICPWYFQNTLFTRKTQLLFQSVTFFPAVPTVANYECCKQDRNQIPNYSELIQKRVAIVGEKKKKRSSSILQGDAGVFRSQTILKEGFLEFNGEHLAQAAKSISLHNIMLARVEQERWLHFNLLHRTFIQI